MKDSLIGKKVRGTNAYGEAVGELGTVIAEYPHRRDGHGNYLITVEYANGRIHNTKSFWVKVVES